MFRALAPAALAVLAATAPAGCGRSDGVPDEQLGNLVVEPKRTDRDVDVARAMTEPAALDRALSQPYDQILAALGPHVLSIKTQTRVDEAGKQVSELTDELTLEHGTQNTFHGLYTNSADYGREAIFVGNKLYLRPRYQRWHGRAPESPAEPVEIRASFYGALPAAWDLVGYAAELTDRGIVPVAGRSGRKVELKLSPSPAKPVAEPLVQRKWREGRSVEALTGSVVLDPETGAPLAMDLDAQVAFSRDGRSFVMKVKLAAAVSNIGTPSAISAPAEPEVVATPGRMREVDDRDYLLQGIAPPIRKNVDGTAVPANVDKKTEDKKTEDKR